MRHWSVNGTSIVRYGDLDTREVVAIAGSFDINGPKYTTRHWIDGVVAKSEQRRDLADAVRLGEEWLP